MHPTTNDWWPYLYGAILFQGLFLGGVLVATGKGNLHANRLLAAIMFMFSLATAGQVAAVAGLYEEWPHLLFVFSPFWFALPPLYYFYTRSVTGEPIRLSGTQWMHAIPFAAVILYFIPMLAWSAETKLQYLRNPSLHNDPVEDLIYSTAYYLQNLTYLAWSIRTIRVRVTRSFNIQWLQSMLIILALQSVLNEIQTVYFFITGAHLLPISKWGIPIYAVVIYSFAYLAFVRPENMFVAPWKLWEQKNGRSRGPEMEDIIRRLESLMKDESLYLNSELKYSDVAAKLGISVRALSDALNTFAGQSFTEFVNSYRIEEAKYQILNGKLEKETVLSVAFGSGFSTKSSFNRIFKNRTGLTPTEFLESVRSQEKHLNDVGEFH